MKDEQPEEQLQYMPILDALWAIAARLNREDEQKKLTTASLDEKESSEQPSLPFVT